MANGHGGIAGVGLLHHEGSHRLAHDVAAAQDDAFLARGLYVVALEQLQYAVGCGRHEAGEPDGEAAYVDGVEAVYILAVVDGLDDALLVDVAG